MWQSRSPFMATGTLANRTPGTFDPCTMLRLVLLALVLCLCFRSTSARTTALVANLDLSSDGHGGVRPTNMDLPLHHRQLTNNAASDQIILCDFWDVITLAADKAKLTNWCGAGDASSVCGVGTSSWLGVTCATVGGVLRVTEITTYTPNGLLIGGSLPTSIGGLDALTFLDLASNQLSGTIPSSLGALTGLTGLYLDTNSLSGGIPSSLGGLTGLTTLWLGINPLSGSIPTSLGGLTGLITLGLVSTSLTGPVPSSFCSLKTTVDLRVQTNPGLTCYPSCLSAYSWFMNNGKDASLGMCAAVPSQAVTVSAALSFSGLTQAVVSADSSGSISTAVTASVASALGLSDRVAAGSSSVSLASWAYTTASALLHRYLQQEQQRMLAASARANVVITASPADLAGGGSAAQVAATLTTAGAAIASAVQQSAAVQAAGISVSFAGVSVVDVTPIAAPAAAPSASANDTGTIIGAAVGGGGGLLLLLLGVYFFVSRRGRDADPEGKGKGSGQPEHAYELTGVASGDVWADVEAVDAAPGDLQPPSSPEKDQEKKKETRAKKAAVLVDCGLPEAALSVASGPSSAAASEPTPPAPAPSSLAADPWAEGLAVVTGISGGPAAAAAEALLPGILSLAREVPLLGPCAGVLLQFYSVYKKVHANAEIYADLEEQVGLGVGWMREIAPQLRSGAIDSKLVEQALRRVVSAVHHATQLVASLSGRYADAHKKGLATRLVHALTSSVLSSLDQEKLNKALAWLKEAISYLLQTIPTVTGLQVKAKLDKVGDDVSAIMALLTDKAQTDKRGEKLQELQLLAADISLGAVIGEGGFAIVYTGKYHRKQVAVKVIRRKDGNKLNAKEREAIENELLITRYLADPNILTVYGFAHEPDRTLVVLEFAPYGSLWEMLYDEATFPSAQAGTWSLLGGFGSAGGFPFTLSVGWLKDLCCAVAHMYARGVKHKDIKAENLLVYAYPDRLIAKLCDFGFARQSSATMSMAGGGTAVFEAPEVRATGKASFASDVFSCGMTAVQILTRQTPGRHDWQDQMLGAMSAQPAGPAQASVQALLLRMIDVEQFKRPNAVECAEVLSAALDSLGGDPRTDAAAPEYDAVEAIEDRAKAARRARAGSTPAPSVPGAASASGSDAASGATTKEASRETA